MTDPIYRYVVKELWFDLNGGAVHVRTIHS